MSKLCSREGESQFLLVENNYEVFLGRNETEIRYSSDTNKLNRFLKKIGDRMFQEYIQEKCLCENVDCKLFNDIKNSQNPISDILDTESDSGIVSWKKEKCCPAKECECSNDSDSEYDECYPDTCPENKNKYLEINDCTLGSVYDYTKKAAKHFFTFSMFLFLPVIVEIELFLNRN